MIKCKKLLACSAIPSIFFFSELSHAAAFQLYELGTPLNGIANVGQAVVADDASVAYFNPASMTTLKSSQLLLGTQIILPYANFSSRPTTTISGRNGGNAGTLVPGATAYFVYDYSPKLKWGVAFTSPYGGALNFDDHWVGRYYVQQMTFYSMNLNPSVAYKINDWAAIGGGVAIEYINMYQATAIPTSSTTDGQLTVKADNVSPGFNLGALFAPAPSTRIGVAYRSQIVHTLRGNTTFFNISASPSVSTKMVMPSNVILSLSQGLTDKFTAVGELGWADWSSMRNTTLVISGFSITTPQNWHDTYRIGLGGRYQYTPRFLWQLGGSYDSSPTSSSRRTPNLPMDRQIRIGTGIEYELIKKVKLGLSYEYINFGSANINNTSSIGFLSGSFSRNYANVFQGSLNIEL